MSSRHYCLFILLLCLFHPNHRVWALDHAYTAYHDDVLLPFVQDGAVAYNALGQNRSPLDRFIAECGNVSFDDYGKFTREQKVSFLLNLYNAATLQLVINNWPVGSIQDIGGLFRSPWTTKFIRLFGRTASLGQILHDILRPEFKDPRIHFALANASKSGPALLAEPYLPETLDEQLDRQTQRYLRERPDANRINNGTLTVSPIFQWYENDFGKRAGVRTFIRRYLPEVNDSTVIQYGNYDWSLNSR